ncbi:N-(5'-phosphoribosyl)anthranilate isomerase [Gloeomargarita lithophora Alchichica-D10]|uniref:N-(5'-phosphoribosyl)anthranilate isomerase n=1 Tax=Gloeomargarita lithophora Alchichica-D10 TaxID=1188229 RepID=A0A1J0AB85_9CYAN|nr:phosphoribosylanthranilate isomerase [Gloeomargarita lithophora]APB33196.1 N-(5'-phosphoribosyl)anthranilate isomerase [Gloeomargarita lithophora Alchichica-D10]
MEVKICGLTRVEQAVAIARMGVTAVGIICVPSSPRYVAPAQQQELNHALADYPVWRVGVFAQSPIPEVIEIARTSGFNALQLHGEESPADCQYVREALPQVFLIKAMRVRDAGSLAAIAAYAPWVDRILLDAYDPQHLGGTGLAWDWQMLADQTPSLRWWLAGGVTPENCGAAVAQTQPDGIDVSSGVEVAPGVKDLPRVEQLLQRIQGH